MEGGALPQHSCVALPSAVAGYALPLQGCKATTPSRLPVLLQLGVTLNCKPKACMTVLSVHIWKLVTLFQSPLSVPFTLTQHRTSSVCLAC